MKPTIGRYPIEIFGTNYNDNSAEAKEQRTNQFCPYINRECTKPRKSEPEIKVGICSLGYKNFNNDDFSPNIICPNRFIDDVIFNTIKDKFFSDWKYVKWVKEVNLGVSGNVDYVAAKTNAEGTSVTDFLCVEFQANGTTGSPYGYVKDLLNTGEYSSTYTFGLNWANEFMKTMMQQVYKKGNVIAHWKRKIVFVIQDTAMDYLNSAVDTSDLRESMDDPIHFMTFSLIWNEELKKFDIRFAEWKSADLNGINKILAGANSKDYITQNDFTANILSKGKADGVFNE